MEGLGINKLKDYQDFQIMEEICNLKRKFGEFVSEVKIIP